MSIELRERNLDTENLPAAAEIPGALQEADRFFKTSVIENKTSDAKREGEQLAPLFLPDVAKDFRIHWDAVQGSFVDDPRQAVRQADKLVAQVMTSLAETFSSERAKLEGQVDPTDKTSTEDLRVALCRYRSFFERLLSL
jgi:hypothetical protein